MTAPGQRRFFPIRAVIGYWHRIVYACAVVVAVGAIIPLSRWAGAVGQTAAFLLLSLLLVFGVFLFKVAGRGMSRDLRAFRRTLAEIIENGQVCRKPGKHQVTRDLLVTLTCLNDLY